MNKELLQKHIAGYIQHLAEKSDVSLADQDERRVRTAYYQARTADKILKMSAEEIYEYIAKLWAMRIWGNKHYVVDKILASNGPEKFRKELTELLWGRVPVADRWDHFRANIKSMGPAMMSELLCYVHPDECMLWNSVAATGFQYLGVPKLPRYDYQLTGEKYAYLCKVASDIAEDIRKAGGKNVDLLWVDYFIWSELQIASPVDAGGGGGEDDLSKLDKGKIPFVHNDIRDKLAEIGTWLGLKTETEIKVAQGAKVDAVWEVTIGNMGRVIYVFEVQTSGAIDSLLMNLLKSLNNAAVQGVVAVSDAAQIEQIRKEASGLGGLREKLKFWNYEDVLKVHAALASVNASINALGLVPQGF